MDIVDNDSTDIEDGVAEAKDNDKEVASSAERDKAEGSAHNKGLARDDVSHIRTRQLDFQDLPQDNNDIPRPSQKSRSTSRRGEGGLSTQKMKGQEIAKESLSGGSTLKE